MGIEDEYHRDYSFEPEFIRRKDSLEMHRSRLERTRKHSKIFNKKISPDAEDNEVKEELALGATQSILEAEIDTFRTVISSLITIFILLQFNTLFA
jgi:hypothetical protein